PVGGVGLRGRRLRDRKADLLPARGSRIGAPIAILAEQRWPDPTCHGCGRRRRHSGLGGRGGFVLGRLLWSGGSGRRGSGRRGRLRGRRLLGERRSGVCRRDKQRKEKLPSSMDMHQASLVTALRPNPNPSSLTHFRRVGNEFGNEKAGPKVATATAAGG